MLSKQHQDIILNHLNKRLKSIDDDSCGFCRVAHQLWESKGQREVKGGKAEISHICPECPLQKAKQSEGLSCTSIRLKHLVARDDDRPTMSYELATDESVELHVDYMLDKIIEFWDLPFSYQYESGKTTIVNRGIKNESV